MLYSGRFDKKENPSPLIPQPYGTQFHRFLVLFEILRFAQYDVLVNI